MLNFYKISLFLVVFFSTFSVLSKPTITVYTYDAFTSNFGPGLIIKDRFEKKFNCIVKFVSLKDGISLLNRLFIEKINSNADIILGLDANFIEMAKSTNLFIPHKINVKTLTMPNEWKDEIFIPYDYSYFAFIYDKMEIHDPPKSFRSFLIKNNNFRIAYPSPRTSTTGLGLLFWIQKIYGCKSSIFWKKFSLKTITITKNWSESYQLLLRGEVNMILSYVTAPIQKIKGKNFFSVMNFSEGHYPQIEVAGLLKSSKHPNLSRCFMKFILSKDFQEVIPVKNWMYPVIKLKLPNFFVKNYKKLSRFSSKEISVKRSCWINIWKKSVSQ